MKETEDNVTIAIKNGLFSVTVNFNDPDIADTLEAVFTEDFLAQAAGAIGAAVAARRSQSN